MFPPFILLGLLASTIDPLRTMVRFGVVTLFVTTCAVAWGVAVAQDGEWVSMGGLLVGTANALVGFVVGLVVIALTELVVKKLRSNPLG